jgi:hypothetical protein
MLFEKTVVETKLLHWPPSAIAGAVGASSTGNTTVNRRRSEWL